jgi:magnesium chelatase accessory protein
VNGKLEFERDGRDWPNREASRFVSAAGIRWHVQIMGSGPEVLLVHGTGASSHSYGELAQILAQAFTVIVPDLPGHAFTELPPASRLSLPTMSADLGELLQVLKLKPVITVGHSAGAAILIEMCLDRLIAPDAVISLNGALLPFGSVAGQFFSPLAKLLVLNPFIPKFLSWRASSDRAVGRLIENTGSRLDPEGIARYARLFQSEDHVAAALGMMAGWDLAAFEKRLGGLKARLILVVGGGDRAISPDDAFKVRDRIPKAELVLLRHLGHLAHEERPEEVAEIVLKAAHPPLAAAAALGG